MLSSLFLTSFGPNDLDNNLYTSSPSNFRKHDFGVFRTCTGLEVQYRILSLIIIESENERI